MQMFWSSSIYLRTNLKVLQLGSKYNLQFRSKITLFFRCLMYHATFFLKIVLLWWCSRFFKLWFTLSGWFPCQAELMIFFMLRKNETNLNDTFSIQAFSFSINEWIRRSWLICSLLYINCCTISASKDSRRPWLRSNRSVLEERLFCLLLCI